MAKKIILYNPAALTEDKLRQEVAALSKAANTRMRSMEKTGYSEALKSYNNAQAMLHGLNRTSKKGGPLRFQERTGKMDRFDLVAEYSAAAKFMSAKISTPKSVRQEIDTIKKGLETWAGKQGVDPSTIDPHVWAKMWKDLGDKSIKNLNGSDQIAKLIKNTASGELTQEQAKNVFDRMQKILNSDAVRERMGDRDINRKYNEKINYYKRKNRKGKK